MYWYKFLSQQDEPKAELKMQEDHNEMQTDEPTEDMQEDRQDHVRGCGDSFAEIAD